MTSGTVARRYGRALFDVGLKESALETAERDLAAFVRLLQDHDMLARVLANPVVPVDRKQAVIGELAARSGFCRPVTRLLAMLAERHRLLLLPAILDEYRRRLREHEAVVEAEVTSAVPLPAGRLEAIARAFGQVTGQRVTVRPRVDPTLIGGVAVRIGSVIYDGSVKRQLERLHEQLAREA